MKVVISYQLKNYFMGGCGNREFDSVQEANQFLLDNHETIQSYSAFWYYPTNTFVNTAYPV